MALQRLALPNAARRRAGVMLLWVVLTALAFALSVAIPVRAVEPDEAEQGQVAQSETPAQPERPQEQPSNPPEEPAGPAPPAQPAPAEKPPAGIEVITVEGVHEATAMEETSSITQFNMEELQALGAQNISDLARVTPNLEIRSITASTPTFFIRGVGLNDFSSNATGAVAIYSDGVPLNAPALQVGQLFDISTVDVIRGPEGYGDNRNASAGAIRSRTNEPTGEYEAALRSDYGINFNERDFQGSIAAPIVPEWLSARSAFRWTQRDPFYRNRCGNVIDPGKGPPASGQVICSEATGNPLQPNDPAGLVAPGLSQAVNDRGRWAARGQLRLQPPGYDTDWLLNVHGSRIDEDVLLGQTIGTQSGSPIAIPGQPVQPAGAPADRWLYTDPDIRKLYNEIRAALPPEIVGTQRNTIARTKTIEKVTRDIEDTRPFHNDYNLVGSERLSVLGSSLRGDMQFGPVQMTTLTGGEDWDRERAQDFDYSSNPQTHIFPDDEGWQITQNLGFEWEPAPDWFAGTVRWGGYFLREQLRSNSLLEIHPNNGAPFLPNTEQDWKQDMNSTGVFGNFSWDFADDFVFDAGARFNYERKDFEQSVVDLIPNQTADPIHLDETWSAPTGGAGITYYFTDEVRAYGKYTRGWKAGHLQANSIRSTRIRPVPGAPPTFITATPTIADPETVDSFEIGARGTWFDGRLEMGGALFYYRYSDYQVFVIENQFGAVPLLKIINANDARVYGTELDFRVEPLQGFVPILFEGLNISGRFGWIESEFLDFTDTRLFEFVDGANNRVVFSSTVDFTGNRLPNTPRFKFSGTAEYRFDLGRWGTPSVRYDMSWTDDVFFDPSQGTGVETPPFFSELELPEYAIGQRAYMLHDLRVGYLFPNSSIEISGWVRNITNEIYKSYVADTTVFFGSLQNLIGEPRTYGVSASVTF